MSLFLNSSNGNLTDNFFKGIVIVLEGLIGVGKTTLGQSLLKYFQNAGIKCKFFKEFINKPLLDMYLGDKAKYAFHFQSIMIRERINIYKKAVKFARKGGLAIIDRGIAGDRAFAKMQDDNGFFTETEYTVYKSLIEEEKITSPDITLYLKTDPKIAYERMQKRGNEAEKQSYTLKYFEDLHIAHMDIFKEETNLSVTEFDWNEEQEINNLLLGEREVRNFLNRVIRSKITVSEWSTIEDSN
jgi:deoxyadenosine/deoxycytidine kinase